MEEYVGMKMEVKTSRAITTGNTCMYLMKL